MQDSGCINPFATFLSLQLINQKGVFMSDFINFNLSDLILYILKQRAKFGNEITSEIIELTNGAMDVKQTTLYGTLKKLEQRRLITSYWEDSSIGGKRHYYLLTDLGREELKNIHLDKPEKPQTTQVIEYFEPRSTQNEAFWHKKNEFETTMESSALDTSTMSRFEAPKQSTNTPLFHQTYGNEKMVDSNLNTYNDSPNIYENNEKEENLFRFNQFENNTKENATQELTEEIINEPKSSSAVFLPNSLRADTNDIITNTINKERSVEMSNTEIDYRNILGELYVPEHNLATSENKDVKPEIEFTNNSTIEESLNVEHQNQSQVQKVIHSFTVKNQSFDNFGIKVKKHSKVSELDTTSDKYLKRNKLNLCISVISYIILCLLLTVSYFVVKETVSSDFNYLFTLVIVGFCAFLYPLFYLILFIANPHKKVKNEFKFKQEFLVTLLVSTIFIVFVIAINFLAGMNNLNQIHFMYYWLIPLLLSVIVILIPCIKKLLILTKKFNA